MIAFANFDLRLSGAAGAYTAEVQDSPAGQASSPVPTACDLAACIPQSGTNEALQAAGRGLWACAFGHPAIAELWRGSPAAAGHQGGLRLRLSIESPELAALPWELLYDEALGRHLALDGRTPVVRFVRLPFAAAPWPQGRPLRLLFTGASPRELLPLRVAAEWADMEAALAGSAQAGRLALDAVPEHATLATLLAGLRQGIDIWHFAGHGGETALVFEDRQGQAAAAEAGTLGMLLVGEGVRLAVLNACRTGTGGGAAASVAGALVHAEIPAVVAMQGALPDAAAAAFAGGFYAAIAAGQPVDRALTSARKAILALGGAEAACWWLPALFLRSPDGVLWQPESAAETQAGTQPAVGGDQIITTGPVATRGSAISTGSGTAVVGDGTTVVSGVVHGDVVQGDQYKVDNEPRADAATLRQAYLHRVLEQTQTLQLSGVDPKAARDPTAQTGLALASVYTALMTQQTEQTERGGIPTPDREARRLSAVTVLDREPKLALLGDPGSGKSTFVNFVALCLAGEALGRTDANLALMTTPLPEEQRRREDKPQPQPWRHAALLPVRVVLRDFAARGLPPVGQRAGGDQLWRFIAAELGDTLAEYAPRLKKELQEQGALLLLDGLDEVPEADARRVQVKQAVQGFAADFPRCRFVVTSRTYAYQRQDWKLPGFAEAVLAPFGWGQIERFVDNWYAHLAAVRNQNRDDAQGRATLLKAAIQRSARLRELAERPLLLTLMASLHAWRGGNLPEKREELYADTVDLLLDQWESPKVVRGPDGQPAVAEPSLTEWMRLDRAAVRKLLEQLAFEAHRSQPNLVGTADIAQERLVNGLVALANNPDVKPARAIEYVRDRAGLLAARGVGVYTFPHRTFQEYLAACYLTDHGYPDDLAELVLADGERWREVALLAGAKAARGTVSAAWNLAEALCCRTVQGEAPAGQYLAAVLAAQTLIENAALAAVSERNRPKAECIRGWLRAIAERGALSPVDRAAAGDALALMGDDRPGVGLTPGGLPDIVWCDLPAGEFVMGSQGDELSIGQETPQHRVRVDTYRISKYPTTNAQYAAFVGDGGYTERWRHCWTKVGWKRKGDRAELEKYDSIFDLPNHPVVMVTWYEAIAFCNWLGEKLRLKITLPSEAQWEKAARGTDSRTYPWGEKITSDHANYAESGINTSSAVGIFPVGASPRGALDMSGNVYEWCLTKYRFDYKTPEDNDPAGPDTRVLRGGAFNCGAWSVRCAVRFGGNPDFRADNFGFRVVASPVA